MFLKFMLARLISARQVVLLCDSLQVHLFYRGQAYSRSTESGFKNLPSLHHQGRNQPIWTLISVDYDDRGPRIKRKSNIWPVQVSPPKPVRWEKWSRRRKAALLGMPRWTKEELNEG